ncbi:hypothetical protein K504DRAFT_469912 [Pleomassaria siparia CBS 279.74]|uniref:Pentatricopeptide repeat protein n=1 Tax=Pleomassaria siparia CBS 279.74 TaxID=1314801 RepID=A0A6G1K4L3_9PLEO|nr:hypothetical protein K504DRAFT_469912 [Pleomassaria siparia CBS 279.74]
MWTAYSLAKHSYPKLPSLITNRAWDVLWATQSMTFRDNPSRDVHLAELYRDMQSVGKSTTVGQCTKYLETIFMNGEEDLALKEWEQEHGQIESDLRQDYKPEHLEVGARMHALAGNADRARTIMEDLFRLYPTWNPSIMMIVFRAHTSLDSVPHHKLAKKIYVDMKRLLGKKTTLRDYDSWLVGFIEARHLTYAKIVFRHMVEDGHLACNYSPKEVEKVLRRLHLLYRLGTDMDKMENIAMHAISVLPRAWHHELFGHWMQTATVKKAPEAATQILEMMFRRGKAPEAFHFNLLLRNLIKTKNRERVLKAENIGWHMIEALRKMSGVTMKPSDDVDGVIIRKILQRPSQMDIVSEKLQMVPESAQIGEGSRAVPPADITTFALIMRHHANKLQWEHIDYLTRQLKVLQLRPNSTIMNVLMENRTRQGKYRKTWEIYKSFTSVPEGTPSVFPDGATFRHLWLSLRLALGGHESRDDDALPTPRGLLAETIHWWDMTRSRFDAERFKMGLAARDLGAISTLMMHCFSDTKDLPGSLVALHALRKKFDIFPSDKTAVILQRQVAWIDGGKVRLSSIQGQFERNLEKMGRVHHMLMQNRFKRMNLTGDQFAYMSKTEVGDLNLNLLSEFIRVVMKREHTPEIVEAMIDQARKDIGLPDLATGDMDAFNVA